MLYFGPKIQDKDRTCKNEFINSKHLRSKITTKTETYIVDLQWFAGLRILVLTKLHSFSSLIMNCIQK